VKPDVAFRGIDADAVEVRNYAKHFACHCHSLTLWYAAWGFSFLSREAEAKVPARLCQEESFRLLNCFGSGAAQVLYAYGLRIKVERRSVATGEARWQQVTRHFDQSLLIGSGVQAHMPASLGLKLGKDVGVAGLGRVGEVEA